MSAADMRIAAAVQVTATALEQMACHINIVLREVFQTILEASQGHIYIGNLNLCQLSYEPYVLDLGLQSMRVLFAKMISEFLF
jgi:hypothetical protein